MDQAEGPDGVLLLILNLFRHLFEQSFLYHSSGELKRKEGRRALVARSSEAKCLFAAEKRIGNEMGSLSLFPLPLTTHGMAEREVGGEGWTKHTK